MDGDFTLLMSHACLTRSALCAPVDNILICLTNETSRHLGDSVNFPARQAQQAKKPDFWGKFTKKCGF
ncbi:hypothetical protein [Hoeflea sp.]|uniref:hypothetical protein n=1 Tax=Hoeflea sp. TaxID=1940281 RepID=UPI003B02E6C9